MIERDAVVALAGDFSPQGGLGESTIARMNTAIRLMHLGVAARLIVSGSHTFVGPAPERPLADFMAEYATENDVKRVLTEDKSLDTVGNALFTKELLTEPNDWKSLTIVTNVFHMPRSLEIYRHVMGGDYSIEGIAAPNQHFPRQRLHEAAASVLTKLILANTEPGDDAAIKDRLFSIVPGYIDMPKSKRIGAALSGLFPTFV